MIYPKTPNRNTMIVWIKTFGPQTIVLLYMFFPLKLKPTFTAGWWFGTHLITRGYMGWQFTQLGISKNWSAATSLSVGGPKDCDGVTWARKMGAGFPMMCISTRPTGIDLYIYIYVHNTVCIYIIYIHNTHNTCIYIIHVYTYVYSI